MKMFPIIQHRSWFLSFSATLIVASIVMITVFGFVPGIDFVGGTLWQVRTQEPANPAQVRDTLEARGVEDVQVYQETEGDTLFIKTLSITEDQHQEYLSALQQKFGAIEELRFESVGPTIGVQLRNRAIEAAIFVLLAISLYIALSFRKVSYPIKSWKYGVVTLVTLFHDIIIPTGVLAVLGYIQGVELDTNFVVALLVVMGFSVHDTIVVFDRIRENVLHNRGKMEFDEVVNQSVNQTLARSINTSLTLIFILVTMLIIGSSNLQFFVLTVLLGTIVGTYSSVCVASPLLTIWHKFGKNK
jgi:preprotein translocase subunit SecF